MSVVIAWVPAGSGKNGCRKGAIWRSFVSLGSLYGMVEPADFASTMGRNTRFCQFHYNVNEYYASLTAAWFASGSEPDGLCFQRGAKGGAIRYDADMPATSPSSKNPARFHRDGVTPEPRKGDGTLQQRIRQKLIDGIAAGVYPAGGKLPSTRKLAKQLGVARNTIVLVYQQLVAEGHVVPRERSGLYVNEKIAKRRLQFERIGGRAALETATEWSHRFRRRVNEPDVYRYPPDWQKYPFPFIEGRFDRSLFPLNEWREATRLSLSVREIAQWSIDSGEADDPVLVEQIRTKVLPRRGITARAEEILITLGTQQALDLVVGLLVDRTTPVAIEEPGNPALRELLSAQSAPLILQPVDENGIVIDDRLDRAGLVYVSPSHQRPTGATLSVARRRALLQRAAANDFIILEDDFDCETNYLDDAYPALRSMEGGERVIYVGGLSRVLSPGLRLGFLVAAPEVVSEARRLRSLTTRHPPLNNQRTAALFLSLGHYDTTMLRLGRVFRERLIALRDALNHYRPNEIAISPLRGGTTYWVRGPEGMDARDLARRAEARGVLIEPVGHYYAGSEIPKNVFRMGVTGIAVERIRDGVATLAEVIREMAPGEIPVLDTRRWMSGSLLHKKLAGATFLYKTVYGDPCTIELREDGRMVGRSGYANEDRDTGRWWIEGDMWCRQWKAWAYGEVSRLYTRIDGDLIQWFRAEGPLAGRLIDSAVYLPPKKRADVAMSGR
ncbi:MAG TPA: PLP-dependent aminotransferase family protein [Rhizomicrobium sp.]|nr:PLP-dependent aminotransferase family protein [Rhizomicrobium sp.]